MRGTVRSLKSELKVKPIREIHPNAPTNLELVEADLNKEEEWLQAVKGVDHIQHIASPVPSKQPKKRDALVPAAVNGTLYVLQAADQEPSVKSVVITSSSSLYWEGRVYPPGKTVLDETTEGEEALAGSYALSKMRAAKAALEHYKSKPHSYKMCLICPSLVVGPTRIDVLNGTSLIPVYFLRGKIPRVPNFGQPSVDVRDVALAHILGMEKIEAVEGEKFLVNARTLPMQEIAEVLHEEFTQYGYKITTKKMGHCMFKVAAFFDSAIDRFSFTEGRQIEIQTNKLEKALNIEFKFRDLRASIIEATYELIKRGHIPDKTHKKK